MPSLLDRIGIELPVFQAGMGGGLSRSALAAAVSEAGGLGTIGFLPDAGALRTEIAATRGLTQRPIAANLLLPSARRTPFEAASEADVVVTFWGTPRRRTAKPWIHQAGSIEEALAARAAGADAVIAQGFESGGHVRGTTPAAELVRLVRAAVPDHYPVLSAGGIADAADARSRQDAGADAVVCGTRFLLTEESNAHPVYKQRLVAASETIVTELFGIGWPAAHRVVANQATERWLSGNPRGPRWLGGLRRATAPVLARVPGSLQVRLAASQRPSRPIFSPVAATADGPESLIDAGPLYAGETVARIDDVRPAAEIVAALAP